MADCRRILAGTGLVLSDLTAMVVLRPDIRALTADLAAPHHWVATTGADGAAVTLCTAGLWCVAAWLGVGLCAVAVSQVPGAFGRIAESVSRVLLPGTIRRLLAGAAGLGVLLAPATAQAAGQAPRTGQAVTPTSAPPIPAPAWPTDPEPATPTVPTPAWPTDPEPATPTVPTPAWPTSSAPTSSAPTSSAPTSSAPAGPSTTPARIPGPAARPTQHPNPPSPPSPPSPIVVRAGDSLWRIARAHLGESATSAQTAAAWPRWYAANRITIGSDPNLIRPGQLLRAPTTPEAP